MDRTSCAKHQETNVSGCAPNVKEPTLELLYGRNISIHMAYEIRDALLALVLGLPGLSQKTKNWFNSTFGTDEAMQTNTQAFRNFLMTCGYCADSLIELLFRNVKGTKELRWCTLCNCSRICNDTHMQRGTEERAASRNPRQTFYIR